MYYLKTTAAFDSAHFLKDYNGKCANLHGHRWQIEAEIAGDSLQAAGEKRGMLEMRKHIAWYVHGMKGASRFRDTINLMQSAEEVKSALRAFALTQE